MKKDYVRFYGVTSEKYLDALHLLSLIYHSSKIYSKCKDVTSEFLGKSIREGFFDENSFSDCYSLARLGECEYALGNFQEAEDCYQIADSLLAKIEGVDNIRALVLNRRATNLTRLGNAELADSCLNAAFELDSESVLNFVMTINNQSVLITEGNPSEAYGMFKLVADYLEENDYQSTPLHAIIKSKCSIFMPVAGENR